MNLIKTIQKQRLRRKVRARAKIVGTPTRPRLSVFRSTRALYAQLIDDVAGHTLVQAHSRELSGKKGTKQSQASSVGVRLAERAEKAGIKTAVFDKGQYKFHGRVKSLVEAARAGGLRI